MSVSRGTSQRWWQRRWEVVGVWLDNGAVNSRMGCYWTRAGAIRAAHGFFGLLSARNRQSMTYQARRRALR